MDQFANRVVNVVNLPELQAHVGSPAAAQSMMGFCPQIRNMCPARDAARVQLPIMTSADLVQRLKIQFANRPDQAVFVVFAVQITDADRATAAPAPLESLARPFLAKFQGAEGDRVSVLDLSVSPATLRSVPVDGFGYVAFFESILPTPEADRRRLREMDPSVRRAVAEDVAREMLFGNASPANIEMTTTVVAASSSMASSPPVTFTVDGLTATALKKLVPTTVVDSASNANDVCIVSRFLYADPDGGFPFVRFIPGKDASLGHEGQQLAMYGLPYIVGDTTVNMVLMRHADEKFAAVSTTWTHNKDRIQRHVAHAKSAVVASADLQVLIETITMIQREFTNTMIALAGLKHRNDAGFSEAANQLRVTGGVVGSTSAALSGLANSRQQMMNTNFLTAVSNNAAHRAFVQNTNNNNNNFRGGNNNYNNNNRGGGGGGGYNNNYNNYNNRNNNNNNNSNNYNNNRGGGGNNNNNNFRGGGAGNNNNQGNNNNNNNNFRGGGGGNNNNQGNNNNNNFRGNGSGGGGLFSL
ncbi:hypothetical protein EPO17_03650 [Patescibacteria group bacterium]|nr:MAG: hypothetical protein EPO17_03650 [Patescibacteria group bacterium]